MLKLAFCTFLGLSVAVQFADSKFSFNGKMMKTNAYFQYPPLVKIAWLNLLEVDTFDLMRPWTWCGGESLTFEDEFDYTMEMTQEKFDKNITTHPSVLPWWARNFNVPEDEISKIKYTMGYVIGHYDTNEVQCGFGNDNTFNPTLGPNGELSVAERYVVFYRNGTWPGPGMKVKQIIMFPKANDLFKFI